MNDDDKLTPLTASGLILATLMLTGCEAVKGIFKAGLWAGVIAAVVVIAAVMGVAKLAKG
jgi:hypothetical protein